MHGQDLLVAGRRRRQLLDLLQQARLAQLPPNRLNAAGVLRVAREVVLSEAAVRRVGSSHIPLQVEGNESNNSSLKQP